MKIYELLNPEKEYFKNKKAIIFDMDGTLIDSMAYWRYYSDDGMVMFTQHRDFLAEKYSTVIEPKPYAVELLKLLKENSVPVCIASDTPRDLSQGFFERHPEFDELIEFYCDSVEVQDLKTNSSKIYEYAANKLGFKKEECIVFEDAVTSAISAANGGFDVIGVFDKINEKNADKIKEVCVDYINDFSDIMK